MFIKVPLTVFQFGLSGNELKTYLYLMMIKNPRGMAVVRRETIVRRCGIRSMSTVSSALNMLESKGLIKRKHRYNDRGYYVASAYEVKQTGSGKWFPLPVECFRANLSGSALLVYLYFLSCRRKNGSAWPSLRRIEAVTQLARNTICKAIRLLEEVGYVSKAKIWKGKHNLYKVLTHKKRGTAPCQLGEKPSDKGQNPLVPLTKSSLHHFFESVKLFGKWWCNFYTPRSRFISRPKERKEKSLGYIVRMIKQKCEFPGRSVPIFRFGKFERLTKLCCGIFSFLGRPW